MAKSRTEVSLQSWDEVDNCLREMGECEIALTEIEADMNIAINDAKEKAAKLAKSMKARMELLEAMIKAFTEDSKADMEGKSKLLTFGRVGFRQSTSISVPTKKLEMIIKNLRKFGMEKCVIVKESVDKEALEKYSDTEIAKVGASRKVEDKFWFEVDKEKIRR